MAESRYYKQIKIPLSIVQIQRLSLAKVWANKNKTHITKYPGYHYIKDLVK